MPYHGGLDWGGAAHAVCVVDTTGRIVARIEARHDAAGLADMLARLKRVAPPAELPVAIERPSGLIVDALVEAGHPGEHAELWGVIRLRRLLAADRRWRVESPGDGGGRHPGACRSARRCARRGKAAPWSCSSASAELCSYARR